VNFFRHISGRFRFNTVGSGKVIALSILAATTFWFFNALNKTYTTTISHPIIFEFEREGVVIVKELPEKLKVNVTGVGWNLFRKSFGLRTSPIKLPLARPTEVKRMLGASFLSTVSDQLSEFKLNFIATDTLIFDIQPKVSKRFRIQLEESTLLLGDLIEREGKIVLTPDTVRLTGPKSLLDTLPYTLRQPYLGKTITTDYDGKLEISFPNHRLVSKNPEEVHMSFRVIAYEEVNARIPISLKNFPRDSSALPVTRVANVRFLVAKGVDADPLLKQTYIEADFRGLNRGDSTVRLQVVNPSPLMRELRLVEEKVKIRYGKRP
jgi:hypothetical protein